MRQEKKAGDVAVFEGFSFSHLTQIYVSPLQLWVILLL